jgi:NitT/TauT family transport system ATP-binding protein
VIAAERAGAIAVTDVRKTYVREGRERLAVDGANLTIAPGSFCSIVGPSGCGKSTLLMMIAGLYAPTSGTIRVDGAAVDGPVPGVGMVFQKDVLLEWRTVLDNVLLPIEVKRLPRKEYREKALALLELVNLRGYADSYPEQLSGGMRQRVAICRALIHDPKLLLMDEPFGALDALTREKLNLDLIALTAQRGQTVLFVTHSIDEAVLMSDQIVVMTASPGRVFRTLPVTFDGSRTLETRAEPRFLQYVTEIREAFHALGII